MGAWGPAHVGSDNAGRGPQSRGGDKRGQEASDAQSSRCETVTPHVVIKQNVLNLCELRSLDAIAILGSGADFHVLERANLNQVATPWRVYSIPASSFTFSLFLTLPTS